MNTGAHHHSPDYLSIRDEMAQASTWADLRVAQRRIFDAGLAPDLTETLWRFAALANDRLWGTRGWRAYDAAHSRVVLEAA